MVTLLGQEKYVCMFVFPVLRGAEVTAVCSGLHFPLRHLVLGRRKFVCILQFKEISGAYEVLADEKKRQLYDDGGEDALKEGGMGGHASPFDVFDMFFGGGGRRRGGEKKGKNTIHALKVCMYICMYSGLL